MSLPVSYLDAIFLINFTGLIASVFATGIMAIYRSNGLSTNRTRHAGSVPYRMFLDWVAKLGALSLAMLMLIPVIQTEIGQKLWLDIFCFIVSMLYVVIIFFLLLKIVTISDLLSKLVLWDRTKYRD